MNILVIAGEKSGDQHIAPVLCELNKHFPNIEIWGTGGNEMQRQGLKPLASIEQMACIGVIEPLLKLNFFRKLQNKIIETALEKNIKLAILIDYGGFNLKIAEKLRQINVPILYFITPKFWAWGEQRINKIKKNVNYAAVILPFEAEILTRHGVKAKYVGNPLIAQIPKYKKANNPILVVGLMPGSRSSEIKRHLKLFINGAKKLQQQINIKIILSRSPNLDINLFKDIGNDIELYDNAHDLIQKSNVILVASGTASLEVALMQRPMVIVYKTDFITSFLFKFFARTKFIGLPNIIMQKRIVPELIQKQATPKTIALELLKLIRNPDIQIQALAGIKTELSTTDVYFNTLAKIVQNMLLRKAHTGEE